MKRWIVAIVAVAFLMGGPALANCGKCGGAAKAGCGAPQAKAGGCGQEMKAGGCGQEMKAGGCGQGMEPGCGMQMKVKMDGCGKGMMPGCGMEMGAGACGSCGHGTPVSQDPSNIWFRGHISQESVFGGHCDKHGARRIRCIIMKDGAGMPDCSQMMMMGHGAAMGGGGMKGCGDMKGCGEMMGHGEAHGGPGNWKSHAGMTCGTGCPHAQGSTAWKTGCSANTIVPKGQGCCGGKK
jgi:hypothetical protein